MSGDCDAGEIFHKSPQGSYERGIERRLDRITELLEGLKVPVVTHVTNPPYGGPRWIDDPTRPDRTDKVGWPVSPAPTCIIYEPSGCEVNPIIERHDTH